MPKEFNIQRHYKSNHDKKYSQYTYLLWTNKVNKLIAALKKESVFSHSGQMNNLAVKASKCRKGNSKNYLLSV